MQRQEPETKIVFIQFWEKPVFGQDQNFNTVNIICWTEKFSPPPLTPGQRSNSSECGAKVVSVFLFCVHLPTGGNCILLANPPDSDYLAGASFSPDLILGYGNEELCIEE